MNSPETVRPVPVPVPVPRPRKSLSPLSNMTTSHEQQLPPVTSRATRSPAKHVTETTCDTRMNSHKAPAESSTTSTMITTQSRRVVRPAECYKPG